MVLTKIPGGLIADSSITAADIQDSTITNAKMAVDPANASNLSSGDVPLAQLGNVPDPDLSSQSDDIALLAFKTQANGNLARYNLVDQSVDAFEDASGVDTSTSVDEIRDSAGKYYSGSGGINVNYWGDGSDGALSTTGNVTHTVPNKVGSYDGDMVIKQYTSLTINGGQTMTVDQPNRGLFIYVSGDCTINGTLSMTNKGGAANPTVAGGSDSNAVGASGLQIGMRTASGTSSFTNDGTGFNGAGTGIRTAIANQANIASNGDIFSIPQVGGAGGTAAWSNGTTYDGATGGTIANGTGGGGQGGGSWNTATSPSGLYANGGKGGAFGGGSGGGGMSGSNGNPGAAIDLTNAIDYGGAGGNGIQDTGHGSSCEEGGAGNPSGTGVCVGAACSPCNLSAIAGSGGGGIIWLLVGGDLTIGATGSIVANGSYNARGATSQNHGAGSSGGGAIKLLHAGAYSNSGSITVAGGGAQQGSGAHKNGGAGGAGSTQQVQVSGTVTAYNNMTLVSSTNTAQSAPTKGDLVFTYSDGAGTAVVGTNITAEYSADAGSTWTDFGIAAGDVQGTTGGHTIVSKNNVSLTSTSGTSMRYRIKTLVQSVAIQTRIHAVSLGWS